VAPSRLSKPGWKILGGLGLGALLWFGVPALVGGMDFFVVRKVEVRGQRYLPAATIVQALPLGGRRSIFAGLDSIEAAGDTIPGLGAFRVSRRLPGTLVVTVREAEPIALVMRGGKLRLVAEGGEVLPFDPTLAAPDLPLAAQADSLVTGLLARVRDADATLFAKVVSASRSGDDVVLTVDGKRYWFRPNAPAEVIRAVTAVTQDLEKHRQDRRWTELDARFGGQVVVRWGAA
jgi:cell division septal protein FtsQ